MVSVPITDLKGNTICVDTYSVDDFPYDKISKTSIRDKKHNICTEFATFDIETTSIHTTDNGVEYKYGFMWHWQACIGEYVCAGRYWDECTEFFKRIIDRTGAGENKTFVIYVHNLGFEYQFMKHIFREAFGEYEVFAPQRRKPLTVRFACGLEFRCSWKLTNMSLEQACKFEKGCTVGKQIGDLDYKRMRTPASCITLKELGYCVADVYALHMLIRCKLKNDNDNLLTIPLTSTSYVRRLCRQKCRQDRRYRDTFLATRLTLPVYHSLKAAARGGDTHADLHMSGRIWRDVDGYDVQSSYPAVMMMMEYPMTKFTAYGDIDSEEELEDLCRRYACLFDIILTDVKLRDEIAMPYITIDKCKNSKGAVLDNGRVLEADFVHMTITEIDWEMINRQYTFDELYVADLYIAEKAPLPQPIRDTIMELYCRKCELKHEIESSKEKGLDTEDLEYIYGKTKNLLNGIFGMMYTDPVHDVIMEDSAGIWTQNRPLDEEEALNDFYKSRNNFLSYAWGVWITAYARRHLDDMRSCCGTQIYCDTDSVYTNDAAAAGKIELLNEQIQKACEEKGAYCDLGGTRYYLGVYEHDKHIERFITLGAKKYAYEDGEGLHITISGVSKKAGASELGKLENFKPGFTFTQAGGMEMSYFESPVSEITWDGCTFKTASGICAIDSTYTIGITGEYAELIGYNIYTL